jgi:RNA polymerase sigma factor (sigma-70 family)
LRQSTAMLTDTQLNKARECALRLACRYRLADAEDVAQDAVLALWSAAERQIPDRFDPWMRTVVRRRVLDVLRRKSAPATASFDETQDTPDCDFTDFDRHSRAESTVAQISDPLTQRIADLVLDGQSIRTAAAECSITETAARKRLRRAAKEG